MLGAFRNDDLLFYQFVFAGFIFLSTLLAGMVPFLKRRHVCGEHGHDFPIGEAVSCGVFLGAGLIHMLSESSHSFYHLGYEYPFSYLLAGISFLCMLSLEHISRELQERSKRHSHWLVLVATLMLSIHSLLSGAALGLAGNVSAMSLIFIAIIVHKWVESFSLAVEVNKAHLSAKMRWLIFLIFSIMTPLGVCIGSHVSSGDTLNGLREAIFTALSAGTFIYIGTLHGLTQAALIKRCCNLREFVFVIFGFALMAFVALWL